MTIPATSGGQFTEIAVGTEKNPENAGCSWQGMHVHQEIETTSVWGDPMIGSWTRQIGDPPLKYPDDPDYLGSGAKCPTNDCVNFVNTDPANWTARTTW